MPITPSNSIKKRRDLSFSETVKCLRYHETPEGRKPPPPPVGFCASNGPSMLQSCGTFNLRHAASSKSVFSAASELPLRNRQSASNGVVMRDCAKILLFEPKLRTARINIKTINP